MDGNRTVQFTGAPAQSRDVMDAIMGGQAGKPAPFVEPGGVAGSPDWPAPLETESKFEGALLDLRPWL